MSERCPHCQVVESEPYCSRHGVAHRSFEIAGRYELQELIGAGASTFVFGGQVLRGLAHARYPLHHEVGGVERSMLIVDPFVQSK